VWIPALLSPSVGKQFEVTMLRRLGIGVLVLLVVALVTLNALAWSGALVDEEAATPPQTVPVAPPAPQAETTAGLRPQAEAIARKSPAKPGHKPKIAGMTLILTATRGDCWVEVRSGSATGAPLYSGTLASGRSLRFSRPKLWLRLGAASNVDVVVNGRPSSVPPGTVELTVPEVRV
jgi:Domain of unknown function (DUF4115)